MHKLGCYTCKAKLCCTSFSAHQGLTSHDTCRGRRPKSGARDKSSRLQRRVQLRHQLVVGGRAKRTKEKQAKDTRLMRRSRRQFWQRSRKTNLQPQPSTRSRRFPCAVTGQAHRLCACRLLHFALGLRSPPISADLRRLVLQRRRERRSSSFIPPHAKPLFSRHPTTTYASTNHHNGRHKLTHHRT